jgi:sulfur carrier protein ThiS
MRIILNAFSFLREPLRQRGIPYLDAPMELDEGTRVDELIASLGLEPLSVEAAFINHKVHPKSTILHEGDRVALLPPGTPGSYRLILGIKEQAI